MELITSQADLALLRKSNGYIFLITVAAGFHNPSCMCVCICSNSRTHFLHIAQLDFISRV